MYLVLLEMIKFIPEMGLSFFRGQLISRTQDIPEPSHSVYVVEGEGMTLVQAKYMDPISPHLNCD